MIYLCNNSIMNKTKDYWIIDDHLIFKPEFNKSLDKYANLLNKYTYLTFSNYNDWNICIETNNKYMYKYYDQYIRSKFNHPIELNQKLTHLTMGASFNKPIQLNQNLTHLTIRYKFDRPIQLTNKIFMFEFKFL